MSKKDPDIASTTRDPQITRGSDEQFHVTGNTVAGLDAAVTGFQLRQRMERDKSREPTLAEFIQTLDLSAPHREAVETAASVKKGKTRIIVEEAMEKQLLKLRPDLQDTLRSRKGRSLNTAGN
jgi:hypothetical protein